MNFLGFIRWLKGYITVECSGENQVSFINFLLKNRINIWNVNKCNENIVFCIFQKDYTKLRKFKKEFKSKVKLKHIGYIGLPRKFTNLKKRKGILFGFIIFIATLYIMSTFVWKIEVTGNNKISVEQIESAYTELGVYVGMSKFSLDSYSLKERLPLILRDVSWCSFNLEGTKLTINITEVKQSDKSNKNSYSNIVAKIDGIVKEIDIISGNKFVKVGDVVSKGDVLISGAPAINSQNFTYSAGEIIAETNRNFKISIPKVCEYNDRTGNFSNKSILNVFGLKIPLYLDAVHFDCISRNNIKPISIKNKSLPISINTRTFYEIRKNTKELTSDETLNEARAELVKQAANLNLKNIQIIDMLKKEDDKYCVYIFNCKCIEDISEQIKINIAS